MILGYQNSDGGMSTKKLKYVDRREGVHEKFNKISGSEVVSQVAVLLKSMRLHTVKK